MQWHRCPHPKCRTKVNSRYFSCRKDWYGLPQAVRDEIRQTSSLAVDHPERVAAFEKAQAAWASSARPAFL